MPEEKSSRGSRRGLTSSVLSQFIRPTANWLAHNRNTGVNSAKPPSIDPERDRHPDESGSGQQADRPDPARVECQRLPVDSALDQGAPGPAHVRGPFQKREPLVDQIVSDVAGPVIVPVPAARLPSRAPRISGRPRFPAGRCAWRRPRPHAGIDPGSRNPCRRKRRRDPTAG